MRVDILMDKVLKNGFKHTRSASEFNIFFKSKSTVSKNSQSSRKSSMVPEKDIPTNGSSMTSVNGCTPISLRPGEQADFPIASQSLATCDAVAAVVDEDEIAVDGTIKKQHAVKFLKMFSDIPRTEVLINYYACAYVGEILTQGYLYVSRNYFCFSSTLFGVKTQMIIPVAEVVSITLEKVAYLIPNAVGIVTHQTKYVFGSLLSRKQTYKLLVKVLEKHRQQNAPVLGPSTPLDSASLARSHTTGELAEIPNTVIPDLPEGSGLLTDPSALLPDGSSVTPVPIDGIGAGSTGEDGVTALPGLSHPQLLDRKHSRYLKQDPLSPEETYYAASSHTVSSRQGSMKTLAHNTAPSPSFQILPTRLNDVWANSSGYLLICFMLLIVMVLVSVQISLRLNNIEHLISQSYHQQQHRGGAFYNSNPSHQHQCSSFNCATAPSTEENLLSTLDASASLLGRVKVSLDRLAEQMVYASAPHVNPSPAEDTSQ